VLIQHIRGWVFHYCDVVAGHVIADAEQDHVSALQRFGGRDAGKAFGGEVVLEMGESALAPFAFVLAWVVAHY
jgi:hypothetical protein